MKKALVALLILTLAGQSLKAQNIKKNELNIGFGMSSNELPNNLLKNGLLDMIGKGQVNTDDKRHSGWFLSYKYNFNEKWALGSSVTYKYYYKEKTKNEIKSKYTQNYLGIALEGQYSFFRRRDFRMYSLVGAGACICRESFHNGETHTKASDNSTRFTYQISPLCFEFGNNYGIKLEYGYGYKGIGAIGAFVRF